MLLQLLTKPTGFAAAADTVRESMPSMRFVVNESDYWDINTQRGIIRGQNLHLRKLNHPTNPFHTCYEVTCEGRQCDNHKDGTVTISVCYPALGM
jgi:hypothetical protein